MFKVGDRVEFKKDKKFKGEILSVFSNKGTIVVLYDKECLEHVIGGNKAWEVDDSGWQLEEKYSKGDIVITRHGDTYRIEEKWESIYEKGEIYYVVTRTDAYKNKQYESTTLIRETAIKEKTNILIAHSYIGSTYEKIW